MKSTILILFLIVTPIISQYVKAENRPLNIAHRGLSAIIPENTIEAFETALYMGADFIELDVILTKQKQLLVMHDPFLSRITNIEEFQQHKVRKTIRQYNHQVMKDWWADEFSLKELKKLKIKQALVHGRTDVFDWKFSFSTLQEVIKRVIAFNEQHEGRRNPDGRLGGILIEAKDGQMYRDLYNIEIGQKIYNLLKKYNIETEEKASKICPIIVQSFDYETVKYWSKEAQNLPRFYLVQGQTSINLTDIAKHADGIGFQDKLLWDYEKNQPTPLLDETKQKGLLVLIWTFRDDSLLFNSKSAIEMYIIAQQQLQLDGVITQFADIFTSVSQLLRANRLEINRQKLWHHEEKKDNEEEISDKKEDVVINDP